MYGSCYHDATLEAALTKKRTIDEASARRLAVKADCDTRTIKKLVRGEEVRGMSGQRALAVLIEAGYCKVTH